MRRLPVLIAATLSILLPAVPAAANDITGMVVGPDAKPVSMAHVYVYTAGPRMGVSAFCPSCYRDCGKHQAVGANGGFHLQELDSTLLFDLLAVADGYEPNFARQVDPMRGPVTIALTPRSVADTNRLITGVVVDPEGKPVVGAAVEPNGYWIDRPRPGGGFVRSAGYGNIPGLDKLSVSNAKGEFALRMPEANGWLDVRVTARALAPMIERSLKPGDSRTIHMKEGATISGRIMRDGKPVPGVPVDFIQRNRPSSAYLGRQEIGTNDDGLFVMTNLGANETYVVYGPMQRTANGVVEPRVVSVGKDATSTEAGTLPIVRGRRIAGTIVVPPGVSIPPKSRITLAASLSGDGPTAEIRDDHSFVFDDVVTTDSVSLHAFLPGMTLSRHSSEFSYERQGIVIPPASCDLTDVQVVLEPEQARPGFRR